MTGWARATARAGRTCGLAVAGVLALVPLLAIACGGSGAPPSAAVAELNKVAPLKQGQPALVFVYTDG